ncbi:venom serine carboxypeptidase-like isoform X3 [Ornithodoros turicata]
MEAYFKQLLTDDFNKEAVYLTQCMKKSGIEAAKRKSKVSLFEAVAGVEAYSGYITVDKTYNSNFFFLYTKTKNGNGNTPIILWLQGGPGKSSLFGQFLENGPVGINGSGHFYAREQNLQAQFDVLYLDQPIGSGYSFTMNTTGYSTRLEHIVKNIMNFLKQFGNLFLKDERDFYVAGEGFGARVAVALSHHLIEAKKRKKAELPLRLQGTICGAGHFGPVLPERDVSDLYHEAGLLDLIGYDQAKHNFESASHLIETHQALQSYVLVRQTSKFLEKFTGAEYDGNILQPSIPPEHKYFYKLCQSKEFKVMFHVGLQATFSTMSSIVTTFLSEDYTRDLSDLLSKVLNSDLKVLVYLGQLDPLLCMPCSENFFRSLKWDCAEAFNTALSNFWRLEPDDDDFVGYIRSIRTFTFLILKNVGHYPGFDRADVVQKMMDNFVLDQQFHQDRDMGELMKLFQSNPLPSATRAIINPLCYGDRTSKVKDAPLTKDTEFNLKLHVS